MTEHDVAKALEVWTLQNLLNISIVLGILASGIAIVQGYYQSLEKHLSLRVSIELWRLFTVLIVDVLLVVVVLVAGSAAVMGGLVGAATPLAYGVSGKSADDTRLSELRLVAGVFRSSVLGRRIEEAWSSYDGAQFRDEVGLARTVHRRHGTAWGMSRTSRSMPRCATCFAAILTPGHPAQLKLPDRRLRRHRKEVREAVAGE